MVEDAGYRMLYEPLASVIHVYDGWSVECDIRRQSGFAFIMNRRAISGLRYNWIARLGHAGMPIYFLGRLLQVWWVCLSSFRAFGLAWYELPFAIALTPVALAYELSGMRTAIRNRPLRETAYY